MADCPTGMDKKSPCRRRHAEHVNAGVDHSLEENELGGQAGVSELARIGFAFAAQRIEFVDHDRRRRQAGQIRPQRRRVNGGRGQLASEIVLPAKPHHVARQIIAVAELRV